MKMKKIVSVALSALFAAGALSSFAACGGGGGGGTGGGTTEQIDTKKTQLYVRNYQGGFGNKWLYNGKAKLEAKYAGQSLEEGKTGVQVMITDIKETPQIANIQNDEYEVYFVEKVQYLYLEKQGVLEDLTSIVTQSNPYDNKAIVSKLTDEQKDFYGIDKEGETKYYALPHYTAPIGIVYDKDLFDEKGYYFIDGYENETDLANKFIAFDDDKRSAGPDGEYDTMDDGLPATYEDFFLLCDYIYDDSNTPINWGGMSSAQFYITALMIQMMADYMGAEDYMKLFTMDGELSELVKLDASGKIVFNTDGTPMTETVTLDPALNNGYETYRHISYYYALEFLQTLSSNIEKYTVSENVKTTTYDAFKAQSDFVASRFSSKIKRQAMLVEGSWWENEATKYFEANAKVHGDEATKANCHYGWMPLPRATKDNVGAHNATMVNTIDSLCFVKKGLSDLKKSLAFDFVQLMNSDESLVDFTLTTNAFKDFNYDLTGDQVKSLTPFGQQMYSAWKNYDVIYPHNANDQYYNSIYTTASSRRYGISDVNAFPMNAFMTNGSMTAAKYFEESFAYNKGKVSIWN